MEYYISRGIMQIAAIKPTGKWSAQVMGEDLITCSFTLNEYIEFEVGDFIYYKGKNYYLNNKVEPTKHSRYRYEYNAKFEAAFYNLTKIKLKGLDSSNNATELEFDITCTAEEIIDLIVMNMARYGGAWTKGVVNTTDIATFQFSSNNCMEALQKIAEYYKMEYWFSGNSINFGTRSLPTVLFWEYGKGNGLYSIQRVNKDSANPFNTLYVYGGTRNIARDYRVGSKRLLMPVAYGPYLQQVGVTEPIEEDLVLDDVYPKRIGTVTSLGDDVFTFSDSSMDFDVNDYLLEGPTPKLTFTTGVLAGYEFEIKSYDHTTKTFVIDTNESETAIEVPSAEYPVAIGDKYFLFDIEMPQTYIDAAEGDLYTKAVAYFNLNANPANRVQYNVVCDPIVLKTTGTPLTLDMKVYMTDVAMGIADDIRINKVSQDLQREWDYEVELNNVPTISNIVKDHIEYEETKIIAGEIKPFMAKKALAFRRYYARFRELLDTYFDPDGYFDGSHIKPNTVETLALAVGAKSTNFKLDGVIFGINNNNDANAFAVSAGNLIHLELQIEGLGFVWAMSGLSVTGLDPAKIYYLYAKCSKSALNGTWVLSENQIMTESEAGFYHFLTGLLYKPDDTGYRSIDLINGVTTIVGDRITAGRITDASGDNYFDLDTGELRAINAYLQGHVEADSGLIGDVEIVDGGLKTPDEKVVINNTVGIEAFKGKIGMLDIDQSYLSLNDASGTGNSWAINKEVIGWAPGYLLLRSTSDNGSQLERVTEFAYNLYSNAGGSSIILATKLKALKNNYDSFFPGWNIGLDIETGNANYNTAIKAIGDTAIFHRGYKGQAYTAVFQDMFDRTNLFVFSSLATGSSPLNVNLPTEANVSSKVGDSTVMFFITIVMLAGTPSYIRLVPPSGRSIKDNNGANWVNFDMAQGDTARLMYYNGDYYVMSKLE